MALPFLDLELVGCEVPSSREDPETGELLCAACLKAIRLPDGTVACSRAPGRN